MPATTTQVESVQQLPAGVKTETDHRNSLAVAKATYKLAVQKELEQTGFTATSETLKRGEIQEVRNVCRWVRKPVPRLMGWERGILQINGINYNAECSFQQNDDCSIFQIIDLRKSDGKHHRIILGAEQSCDCEAATYRAGVTCKHVRAVEAAITWLDERGRIEWEAEVARRLAASHPEEVEF